MALPFIKPRRIAGEIISRRLPDAEKPAAGGPMEALKAVSKDLIDAVAAGDEAAVASALQAAFMILESAPHDEAWEGSEG